MRRAVWLLAAMAAGVLGILAAAEPARAQGCTAGLEGQERTVSGRVTQSGEDDLGFLYMIIFDSNSGCYVMVDVADEATPCGYGQTASVTMVLADAGDSVEVDYWDGGGEGAFTCY